MAGFVSEERLTYGPWQALERMLVRLAEHSGFKDVALVGGAGDHGADVVGTFKGKRWVIQSKYRQSGCVDSSAAKEAVRALASYGGEVAVAATSQFFSPDAHSYQKSAKSNGIDLRLWNGAFLLDYYSKLPSRSKAYRELREYQVEAVDSIEKNRGCGESSGLVIMATGLGKSMVANQLIVNELERNPRQEVLVLAHTKDLVRQLEASAWPILEKQHSTHLWTDGEVPAYSGGVVFATWQSLAAAVQRDSLDGRFGLVVVDEAHHAPSRVFSETLEAINPRFLVGLTATPWRGDNRRLEDLFGEPAFTMDIVDGMQRGFLARVDYRMLTDGIDWNEVAALSREGHTLRNLNQRLIMPERDVAVVEKIGKHFSALDSPRALVFCRSIEHANRLQPLLAAEGIRAAQLHSGLSREQKFLNLSSFRAGLIDCLLSVEMLNEGIDVPEVNLVVFVRVTHSRRIFIQQLGRGLRVRPGKTEVLVLDFVADLRRIAAGVGLNRDAAQRGNQPEVVSFSDGRIVQFENDQTASFFNEYLADVADIEDMDDGARLKFPDTMESGEEW